jgi:hypothetical protein
LNCMVEKQLDKRIERKIKSGQRRSSAQNILICAVVLILGIVFLLSIITSWFNIF